VPDETPDWLSAEDVSILALEGPVVAGHTCKVIEFAPDADRFSLDDLRARIQERLDAVPRLRRKLDPSAPPLGRPAWVDDPEFEVQRHVFALPIARPLDDRGLRDAVAGLMRARLDRSPPLWSVHLIPELSDGGAALVLRIHHALADGSAAMRIASRVVWQAESGSHHEPGPAKQPAHAGTGGRPRGAHAISRELRPLSARTALAAHISARRAVAFASTPLGDIKQIQSSVGEGVTVNDVVLCAVGGGLRRGLLGDGRLPRLRAKVPVNMHRPDEPDGVGNRDSFICVDLDVGERDPVRRLLAIRDETRERKLEGDAQVLDELLHGRAERPGPISRLAARWSMSPCVFALNVSNVRGPSEPLSVVGWPVRAVYSLAEVAQRHAVRVACMSASGQMTFGLCSDADAVSELDEIAAGIEAELAELGRAAAGLP
jgi:diacylglycerol O-acyltransferase